MLPRVALAQCLGQFPLWFKTNGQGPAAENGRGVGSGILFGEVALKLRLRKTTLPWPVPSISLRVTQWAFPLDSPAAKRTSRKQQRTCTVIDSRAIKRRTRDANIQRGFAEIHPPGPCGRRCLMANDFTVYGANPTLRLVEKGDVFCRSGGVQDASLAALVKGRSINIGVRKDAH